ncbi:MAG: ppnK [Actinomycetia bacterium]|nr:ppnK [Actinomycetes bacterium]
MSAETSGSDGAANRRRLRAIGIVSHPDRPLASELARKAADWFVGKGIDVRIPEDDIGVPDLLPYAVPQDAFAEGLDLVLSLGGDGTMLRAMDVVYEAGTPVLGVNVGQMGYLTEVEPADLEAALLRLFDGDYVVADRMMLEVTVESDGPAVGTWWALNEAVIEKVRTGRLVRLEVSINGTYFTSYAADGVIVATPTGSTAYSFSARGPIVSPRLCCMLLTPVSPHMLFDRSLVLDPSELVRFEVTAARSVVLTLDGRVLGPLEAGDVVSCTGGPRPARVVTLEPRDFHQILKAKFGLADR